MATRFQGTCVPCCALTPKCTAAAEKREVVRFRSLSPEHWVEFMRTYFGPAILAFQHSSPEAGERLKSEMGSLLNEYNVASNGTTLAESEYLDIVATRR